MFVSLGRGAVQRPRDLGLHSSSLLIKVGRPWMTWLTTLTAHRFCQPVNGLGPAAYGLGPSSRAVLLTSRSPGDGRRLPLIACGRAPIKFVSTGR